MPDSVNTPSAASSPNGLVSWKDLGLMTEPQFEALLDSMPATEGELRLLVRVYRRHAEDAERRVAKTMAKFHSLTRERDEARAALAAARALRGG